MTRINCIPVKFLTDQHLLAEYREITRVSKLARVLKPGECPEAYTLGTGHVKFFYDKGGYLMIRTEELYRECKIRGFNVQRKFYNPHPEGLNNHWEPELLDESINLARIERRIVMNPEHYTYNGVGVKSKEY